MNKLVIALLAIVLFLSVVSAANAQDNGGDYKRIIRPTYTIIMQDLTIVEIDVIDGLYPVFCDGYAENEHKACVLMGVNDSIPEFLDFIAENGEAILPRETIYNKFNV